MKLELGSQIGQYPRNRLNYAESLCLMCYCEALNGSAPKTSARPLAVELEQLDPTRARR